MNLSGSFKKKGGGGLFLRVVISLEDMPTSHAVSLALFDVHMQQFCNASWVGTKPGLWTLEGTMDWTMDWIMDSILD